MYDESPRSTWKLAIVEELRTGKDGLVRAANIKTSQGRTNRPIAKLIPLEVSTPIATETDRPNSVAQKDTHTVKDTVDKRPQRAAAQRGREKVMNWVEQLGPPWKMSWTDCIVIGASPTPLQRGKRTVVHARRTAAKNGIATHYCSLVRWSMYKQTR